MLYKIGSYLCKWEMNKAGILLFLICTVFVQAILTSNQTEGIRCISSIKNELGNTIVNVSCIFEQSKCDSAEEGLTLSQVKVNTPFRVICRCPPNINNCDVVTESANRMLQYTNTSLTLRTENVTIQQAGLYKCELVPAGSDAANIDDFCNVNLLATNITNSQTQAQEKTTTGMPGTFTEAVPSTHENDPDYSKPALIIAIVAIIAISVIVLILVFYFYKRWKRRQKRKSPCRSCAAMPARTALPASGATLMDTRSSTQTLAMEKMENLLNMLSNPEFSQHLARLEALYMSNAEGNSAAVAQLTVPVPASQDACITTSATDYTNTFDVAQASDTSNVPVELHQEQGRQHPAHSVDEDEIINAHYGRSPIDEEEMQHLLSTNEATGDTADLYTEMAVKTPDEATELETMGNPIRPYYATV